MKVITLIAALLITGCAAPRAQVPVEQKVAWVPCDMNVVAFEDPGKTVAKVVTSRWFCENR